MSRRTAAVGVLLACTLIACRGDKKETAGTGGPSTSTANPTVAPATTSAPATTAPGAVTTASPAPACPSVAAAAGATDKTTGTGDFDGDGKQDTLVAYQAGSTWHLRMELGGGGAADTTVTPQGPVAVKALGGVGLGKPNQVAFATVGSGASSTIVGLYVLKSCQIRPVVNEEAAATFPIGGSVGNTSGLECTDYGNDGTQNLVWHKSTSTDGVTYKATDIIYAFSGESIATTAPGTVGPVNIAASDPQFKKYSSLTCGSLKL